VWHLPTRVVNLPLNSYTLLIPQLFYINAPIQRPRLVRIRDHRTGHNKNAVFAKVWEHVASTAFELILVVFLI